MSEPSDTRFQFQVIQELAQSVRTMGETQTRMLERLARIEEHRVHELVGELTTRVDRLERTHDEQRGAAGMRDAIIKWWPVIALALLIIWTAGRAMGVFHLPERRAAVEHAAPASRQD